MGLFCFDRVMEELIASSSDTLNLKIEINGKQNNFSPVFA